MSNSSPVLEYKCPCCNGGLKFGTDTQKMYCEYCENTFDLEAVEACNANSETRESFEWADPDTKQWSNTEQAHLQSIQCPSCGGEILTDVTTAATFCPYCENPAVIPCRVSGGLKPDAVIPFKKSKEDAQKAFSALCKGKPLLPKDFSNLQRRVFI